MSATAKCSFCDSSEEKNRESIHNALIWDQVKGILLYYFPNFSYAHFQGLCNSCFEYVNKFSKHRTIWMKNEKLIQTKRQSGQFKGLKHLIKLKKSSSVVCRLCFKESCSEDVVFLYLDNNCYQPGYIQQIMNLHANDIDFKLTESPVVCQECLDVVQTFDALYQMSVENQGNKEIPDLILRDSKHLGGQANKGDQNEVVHLQLKKNEDNSLVLRSVTENESAVRCLMKNKESDNIILNGWTVRKVLDLMQQPKPKAPKSLNQDAYVISDEEPPIDQNSEPSDSKHESDEEIGISTIPNEESISVVQPEDHSDCVDVEASNNIIEIDDSDEEQLEYPKIVEVASFQETHGDPHIFDEFDDEVSNKVIDIDKEVTSSNSLVHLDSETESDQESTSSSKRPHIQGTDNLEEDLSAFLLFNKDSRMNTEQNFLKGLQGTSHQTNDKSKKLKLSATIPFENFPVQNDSKSFASAYDQFLKDSPTNSAWKLFRGLLFGDPTDDKYCTWYPYCPPSKKMYPSKKVVYYITALEDRFGKLRVYRCNICLRIMTDRSEADGHQCHSLRKIGSKKGTCDIIGCNFYTYNEHLMEQHLQAHTLLPIDKVKCSYCEFFSNDTDSLNKHKKEVHETVNLKGTFSKCPYCFFQSNDSNILQHHISVRHNCKKKSKFI